MTDIDKIRIKLKYAENFKKLIESLCLTDRQKQIAMLKYLRGWANADIAEELYIDRRTVTSEMKVIREIIGRVAAEELDVDGFKKT